MSRDSINTITFIALFGTVALEAFIFARSEVIDYLLASNFPIIYSVFNEILIVVATGFEGFLLLGLAVLFFDKEREQ